MTDLDLVKNSIKENTVMIWIETPTNPTLKLVDIEEVAKIGKDKGVITAVDNTFATPFNSNPILLGADVVIHSLTKYIAGHSDVIGG